MYHGPSKTVIEADLLFNLPSLTEQVRCEACCMPLAVHWQVLTLALPSTQYSKSDKKTHFPFLTSILGPGSRSRNA